MRTSILLTILLLTTTVAAADMEWVKVTNDSKGFQLVESGKPFVPWGFNYDHDLDGTLLEDYWDDQWPTVESAFQAMKGLGANVVRIHLQFGRFMESPTKPRQHPLDQLARLIKLAEQTGLYLNVTGLGCYHKADVPPWYDKLGEQQRWRAQAVFWEAIAKTCADSPAIFYYDLMNEPVVAGGNQKRDDWLGPGFGGKHFVQYITLDRQGRERPEIARQWIRTLVQAIRKHDPRRLVTVGLVPWSLDRPGLTSGFIPDQIAEDLDFIAVHLYPETGKLDEAIETLQGFAAVGKPVVIEEIFPLKCSAEELGDFIDQSRKHATGWIGFFWGKTPEELRPAKTIPEAMTLGWLELFQAKTPQMLAVADSRLQYREVTCEGTYQHHLQGICVDEAAIYWSFTTMMVKTDLDGKLLKAVSVANHHGDLCCHDGKLYVAVNLGKFNDPNGNADSWVYVYDADTLEEVARHEVQEVFHGAGGIGFRAGRFFVVGGLPDGVEENYVYEYDGELSFITRHIIPSGHTLKGIQTATFANGCWWFGCYGNPRILLVTEPDFQMKGRYEFDCSLGIEGLADGRFLSATGRCEQGKGCTGSVQIAVPDEASGLRYMDETVPVKDGSAK